MRPSCSFEGCGLPNVARRLCQGHYKQHQLGTPLRPLVDRSWSAKDVASLREIYAGAEDGGRLRLREFATATGRDEGNISRKARELGLTRPCRPKSKTGQIGRQASFFGDDGFRAAVTSATIKKHQRENGHPRGMLGKRHTPETLAAVSADAKRRWADPTNALNSERVAQVRSDHLIRRIASGAMRSGYTRSAGGKRTDLGDTYFRSSWEANYARYLNWLRSRGEIIGWAYEPTTFVFEAIKRGTRAYTPDFRIDLVNGGHEWHEVKGWMDAKSRTRLKRMAKFFPEEAVRVIDAKWFAAANKGPLAGLIPNWERRPTRKSAPLRVRLIPNVVRP